MTMTDDEIREAAAEKLQEERLHAAHITETTPADISPAVLTFGASLDAGTPVYVPVIDDAFGRYGWCSDGVRLKVAAAGGEAVYGWAIWEWSPVLLTAEFHCVWRSPAGDLSDITPKPRQESRIVFVEDPSVPADFDFDNRPRNRRMNIYPAVDPVVEAEAMDRALSGSRRTYEMRRAAKAGMNLDAWLARKVPADPLTSAVDELIAVCAEFEEHYDSLGTSGLVSVDEKFIQLARRRMALQKRCETLIAKLPSSKL